VFLLSQVLMFRRVEYARASLARKIIRDRVAVALNRECTAKRKGYSGLSDFIRTAAIESAK
jgi:hypothetical protein